MVPGRHADMFSSAFQRSLGEHIGDDSFDSGSNQLESEASMQGEPEVCRDFRKGVCFRVNCRYAHINADGTPGTPNDQPVCRDFENGRCFRSNCRFFHRSAPELVAANLANAKRQGDPSANELIDRFGPLSRGSPDFPSYHMMGGDLSPSAEFPRDARSLLAHEVAKRELALSNRMLELSLAERALLELNIREQRQALGRLEPNPYQGLTRRDSVPVAAYKDLQQLGVRPSPTLQSSLNRTRSVPVQSFQDLRGVVPPRHAEVLPSPPLDRRSSVPAQVFEQEAFREEGGYGWRTPGGGEPREYAHQAPPLGRSTSETVQHLQEMRRAADSLLMDLERARRKESLSMPGSPELVSADRAPRLELDPRLLNRGGDSERHAPLMSAPMSPELLRKYCGEPIGRTGSGKSNPDSSSQAVQSPLEGRVSPHISEEKSFTGERKSPEPNSEESFKLDGEKQSERSELSPNEEADQERKSRSLQTSPETRPMGFKQETNGPDFGGEVRRGGSGIPEALVRTHSNASQQGIMADPLARMTGGGLSLNHTLQRGGSGAFTPNTLSRRPSGTPSAFQEAQHGSIFTPYREQGPPWLSPEEQKELFRQEQAKMYDQDRAPAKMYDQDRAMILERAMRAQQLARQASSGFNEGSLDIHGHEGHSSLDPELASRFQQFRPEQGLPAQHNQHPLDFARFPVVTQQQQQRQQAPQAPPPQQSSRAFSDSRPLSEAAPGPATPPASVPQSPEDFQEYSPFGGQPSLFKESSGKSIW